MVAKVQLTWMPDLIAERSMELLSIAWEVISITFDLIDLKESQHNGARLGDPIVKTLVEDYVQAMVNGDTFPRVIVYKTPTGYVLLWGNQRTAAIGELIKAGKLTKKQLVEAYCVQTSDKLLLEALARSGNVGHGGRSEKEERIAHAVYSVRSLGMLPKDCGKLFNVADTTITLHMRAEDIRKRLAMQGINTALLSLMMLDAISGIDDENIQAKVAHLAVQHNPPATRVKQLVAALRKAGTHNARLGLVKDFEKELTEAAHRTNGNGKHGTAIQRPTKVPRRPRRDRVIGMLTQLANYLDTGLDGDPFKTLSDLQVAGDADCKTIINLYDRIDARMKVIVRTR